MTDNEKTDLILSGMTEMKNDVQKMQTDTVEIRQKVNKKEEPVRLK